MRSLVLGVALVATFATTDVTASDWTRWRGPNGDGLSPEIGWNSQGKEEPLWSTEVGLGYACVAVANERVYTKGFFEDQGEDVIVCLDQTNGKILWSHSYSATKRDNMHEGGTQTSPVIDEDRVYVLSREGTLFCFEAEGGEVIWKRRVDQEFEVEIGIFGFSASPLIWDDLIILNIGKVVAMEKESGEAIWESENYGSAYTAPTFYESEGNPRLATFGGAGLALLDADDGRELSFLEWKSKFQVNAATPIIHEETVFISTGYDDRGCALLDTSGDELKVRWESKVMLNKMTGCVLIGEHLYGFHDTMLKCVDLQGKEAWRERGLGNGSLSASDGRLIVISGKGDLIIANASPEGFEEQSRRKVFEEGKMWTMPILSEGLIYCRNNKGTLVCFDHRAEG